jgi:sugar transferase (PEP-CTERM/EpsH1 system associated)
MGWKTMKIRIVHVLYSFGLGGLEGMVAGLINNMDADTFSHSICVLHDDLASFKKIRAGGASVYVIKRHFTHDPSVVIRMAALFRKIRPDIVRTYNWAGMEGIVAARLSDIKTVIHSEHGSGIVEAHRACRAIERRILLKNCAGIIAVSKAIQSWLVGYIRIGAEKVLYIPNGCDTSEFYPGKDAGSRRRSGITDGDIVIGSVGRLIGLKDHELLIRAFCKFAMTMKNVKLMIVGDGPLRKDLENLSEKLGIKERVIFTGNVTEISPFYRAMDIFALPSTSENVPNALLEAMSTALPVIATDVGDIGHMLDGGKCGIIVRPKDVDALASSLTQLVGHPDMAKDLGANARKRVENSFNIKNITDTYETLYKSLAKRP